MKTRSDYIEDYIKKLLALSSGNYLDIQRSELARKFNCVPSQINYVLTTRFTPERGFMVESHRGGRGFMRIVKIRPVEGTAYAQTFSSELDIKEAQDIIKRIYEDRLVTRREAGMLEAAIDREIFKGVSISEIEKKLLICRLFQNMLGAVLKDGS